MTASKTALRKALGRGKFSVADFAAAQDVTTRTARNHLRDLRTAGAVEVVGKIETGKRGRPAHLFRVTPGKG